MDGDIYKAFNVNRLGIGAMFEDVPGQAKDVLDYTNASVFLFSNIGSLDGMHPGRLFRIARSDGNPVDLSFITRCL